jgi:hypothetical protein
MQLRTALTTLHFNLDGNVRYDLWRAASVADTSSLYVVCTWQVLITGLSVLILAASVGIDSTHCSCLRFGAKHWIDNNTGTYDVLNSAPSPFSFKL